MNRDPEHCKEFLLSELGTTGNMDGQGSLIIRGKFQANRTIDRLWPISHALRLSSAGAAPTVISADRSAPQPRPS